MMYTYDGKIIRLFEMGVTHDCTAFGCQFSEVKSGLLTGTDRRHTRKAGFQCVWWPIPFLVGNTGNSMS